MTDTPSLRKARGAFYTPPALSRFIADWAIRLPGDSVLEPSAGEASFLLSAGDRLRALRGGLNPVPDQLHGVELHPGSARNAKALLAIRGLTAVVDVCDFFDVEPAARYDAVIGNPPYIRYQDFVGAARAKGLKAALSQGVRLTGLTSSWAPFTIHATRFLKAGGRLGLVLPAELLSVSYAAEVRRFLLERFETVRLVMFQERVFPGVLEEVVLLLAEGAGPAPSFEVFQARDTGDLERGTGAVWTHFTPDGDGKWLPALVDSDTLTTYRRLSQGPHFVQLKDWGGTYLGAVTGNNKYFAFSAAKVQELGLTEQELLRISPPGSRHLTGLSFSTKAWRALAEKGEPCYLFFPDESNPTSAAKGYVHAGEAIGVQNAYKCRVRRPWWRVPMVKVPDLLVTYMAHDRPRIVSNAAKVHHLNSLYGITLAAELRTLGGDLLPLASINSITLLGGETVGRAYGGGLLKLEPREAGRLPVPAPQVVEGHAEALRAVRPRVSALLRSGRLAEAVSIVDQIILTERTGITAAHLESIRTAHAMLSSRRATRGKSKA